jgi:hypothetical protein
VFHKAQNNFTSPSKYLITKEGVWNIGRLSVKVWVFGRSLAGIAGSNPGGGMEVCCECCQVEVSATS